MKEQSYIQFTEEVKDFPALYIRVGDKEKIIELIKTGKLIDVLNVIYNEK